MLKKIVYVAVFVSDQSRALDFYTDVLGFEKRTELSFGGGLRWIELAPDDTATSIAICPPGPGVTAGGKETGISLHTEDVDAFHAHLKANNVDVDDSVGRYEGAPPTFWFRDPEGNSLMVSQAP
jgi:catechol 2,3-dioxygenase-like lactoylglutathione lyase family enzyme